MENSQRLNQINELSNIKELIDQGFIVIREDFFGYSEKFAGEMDQILKNLVSAAIPTDIDIRSHPLPSKCAVCKQLARLEIPLQEVVAKFLEEMGSSGSLTPPTKKFLLEMIEWEINLEREAYGDEQFIYAVLTKPHIFKGG